LRLNATYCKVEGNRLKIRRGQPRGGSTPPPGTIQNANILCGIRSLPRSLVRCIWVAFGPPCAWVRVQVQRASPVVSIPWLRLRRTLFLLIILIYVRLRNAQRTWSSSCYSRSSNVRATPVDAANVLSFLVSEVAGFITADSAHGRRIQSKRGVGFKSLFRRNVFLVNGSTWTGFFPSSSHLTISLRESAA
jgi:hypothetical protein